MLPGQVSSLVRRPAEARRAARAGSILERSPRRGWERPSAEAAGTTRLRRSRQSGRHPRRYRVASGSRRSCVVSERRRGRPEPAQAQPQRGGRNQDLGWMQPPARARSPGADRSDRLWGGRRQARPQGEGEPSRLARPAPTWEPQSLRPEAWPSAPPPAALRVALPAEPRLIALWGSWSGCRNLLRSVPPVERASSVTGPASREMDEASPGP